MVNAIATLLFTQSYLPGALVLGKTLKQFGLPNDVELVILLATSLTDYEMDQLKVSIIQQITGTTTNKLFRTFMMRY